MTDKMRDFVKGLLPSLTGAPLPYAGKAEPVAYLYNGVRLPPLPEWDKEAYPYAVLQGMNTSYRFNVSSLPIYTVVNDGHEYVTVSPDAEGDNWEFNKGYEAWKRSIFGGGVVPIVAIPVFWANYDVQYEDGTLYLAASEPVPVYE